MVFNATLNNISVISWRSILLVEENTVRGENHRSKNLSHIVVLDRVNRRELFLL